MLSPSFFLLDDAYISGLKDKVKELVHALSAKKGLYLTREAKTD